MIARVGRWALWLCVGAATVSALALPFRGGKPDWMYRAFGEDPATEGLRRRTRAVWLVFRRTVSEHRAGLARDAWAASAAEPGAVLFDRSVPLASRRALAPALDRAWIRLGPLADPARGALLVFVNDGDVGADRRNGMAPRAVEMTWSIPEAGSGARCGAIVRLSTGREVPPSEDLLGPCGFWAAFGEPGPLVRQWVGARDYALARRSDWGHDRPDETPGAQRLYLLPADAARCAIDGGAACRRALGLDDSVATASRSRLLGPEVPSPVDAGDRLGPGEAGFLADMVRDIGADRFRTFWTSGESPESAFLSATGTSLADWTRAWLLPPNAPAPRSPSVSRDLAVWVALFLALLAVAGTWRSREFVLD